MTETKTAASVAAEVKAKYDLTEKETLLVTEIIQDALEASGEFDFWGDFDIMPMDNWDSKNQRGGVLASLVHKGVVSTEIGEDGQVLAYVFVVDMNGNL